MPAVAKFGQLGVRGNRLVDATGKAAMLRGVSLFWSQWQSHYYDSRTLRWLRDDWKIDVVRVPLGVHRGGYLEHPLRETRKVTRVIESAIELGIYVIVDWHAHRPETQPACEFFSWLAEEYGRFPNLIYETWNEPDGRYGWSRDIKPYHEAVIRAIRASDPNNLVIASTPHWCHRVDEAASDPLQLLHVAYALHFYAGSNRQQLRAVAGAAQDAGAALFVSEWGTCRADAGGSIDLAETMRWWEFLESRRISYVNWSIADKEETAAALRPGASPAGGWDQDQISESGLLVRAQLRACSMSGQEARHNGCVSCV